MTRNGSPLRLRPVDHNPAPTYLGRLTCITCGGAVPRGSHRPYCLDHAPHAQRVIRELARLGEVAA